MPVLCPVLPLISPVLELIDRPGGRPVADQVKVWPDWESVARDLGSWPGGPEEGVLEAALRRAGDHDLTASQRVVFAAAATRDLPAEALAAGLGPSRSAIYQALFRARRAIAARLAADGAPATVSSPAARIDAQPPLGRLLAADPGDTGCDVAFQALDRYADADHQDGSPWLRFPGVASHLGSCRPCSQDYEDLLAETAAPGTA